AQFQIQPQPPQSSPSRVVKKPSRRCCGRYQRITALLVIGFLVAFFHLTSNCWPSISGLFEHRRYYLEQLSNGRTCFGRHQVHRVPSSLLARPLKHVAESASVQNLT